MKVIDASVVCKWFVQEVHTDLALVLRDAALRGEEELVAPDLLIIEVANALRWKKSFDEPSVSRAVRDIVNLGVDIVTPTLGLVSSAVLTAYENKLTVYDALYVTLARDIDAQLVTADEKLIGTFEKTGLVLPLSVLH